MNPASSPLFEGCGTALITPFRDGRVDTEAFAALIRAQIRGGADALIVAGTTGESPTLTPAEKETLFTLAVRTAEAAVRADAGTGKPPRRVPVIAGTGSNSTACAVELSRMAESCGCDGLLVVTPYYNKSSPEGLVRHYTAVADAVNIPLLIYHVPGRTGCKLPPEVCRVLADHPRIAGLKDATGDIGYTARVAAACGDRLPLYAGNDDAVLPILSLGGRGVISVVSNLFPARMAALCRRFREGDLAAARAEQLALLPLCAALFAEVNPIPIKAAMEMAGYCTGELRLPLVPADDALKARLSALLQTYGQP